MNKVKKDLEIKSHSDELLKEVEHFMKNRPQYPIDLPPVVEQELREEVEFLRRVLRNSKKGVNL